MIDTEKVKTRALTIRENIAKIKRYAELEDEEGGMNAICTLSNI